MSRDATLVERVTREGDAWTRATFGAGESVELVSVGLSVAIDALYADVPLPDGS